VNGAIASGRSARPGRAESRLASGPDSRDASGIVWLASYPKSGNTWLRVFLRSLLDRPFDDPDLDRLGFGGASTRSLFDDVTCLESSDMTLEEIRGLRPAVFADVASATTESPVFFKVHDAYEPEVHGDPGRARAGGARAIYIVRNPLDVAVSYMRFHGESSPERVLEYMAAPDARLASAPRAGASQLEQPLGTWSAHVEGWMDARDCDVHVVRYEDMVASPLATFRAIVRFAGIDATDEAVVRALEQSAFDRLQRIEASAGFAERAGRCERFFRKGKVGGWRDALSEDHARRIIEDHGAVMRRLGYSTTLDDRNDET